MVSSLLLPLPARAATAEEFTPLPAAQAEAWVAEERDYLTDILWIGIDGYYHVGEWEECLRLCKEITVIDPHFVEAYTNAAYLLWSNDRDEEAIVEYKEGIAANPDSPDLYFDYGFFYRNRKQFDKAIEQFRLATEKGATRTQQHMLPHTLESAGRKEEAIAEWRKLLKRFPEDPIAKQHLARLEAEANAKP